MSAPAVPASNLRPDEKPLAEYRSVSRIAVFAALFGVASAAVLISPLLVVVPLAAVVLAVVALRSIDASEGQLVGRVPALVGLSLAVLFVGWGFSRYVTRQTQLEKHAQAFAEQWLALMAEGRHREAYQLQQSSAQRFFSAEALEHLFDDDPERRDMFQTALTQPPLSDFLAEGRDVRYRYEGVASSRRYNRDDFVVLHYVIERPAQRGGERPMWVTVQRTTNPMTGHTDWLISGTPQANSPGESP